jgi:hypothetical protein
MSAHLTSPLGSKRMLGKFFVITEEKSAEAEDGDPQQRQCAIIPGAIHGQRNAAISWFKSLQIRAAGLAGESSTKRAVFFPQD